MGWRSHVIPGKAIQWETEHPEVAVEETRVRAEARGAGEREAPPVTLRPGLPPVFVWLLLATERPVEVTQSAVCLLAHQIC